MFDMVALVERSTQVRAGLADLDEGRLEALVVQLEDAVRVLTGLGLDVVAEFLVRGEGTAQRPRLRDLLAGALNISAHEAGSRIAAAGDLAGARPRLEQAAAASREGLLGAEAARIVRDTVDKLPGDAAASDIAHFDAELTAIALSERPEVLRREAAKLLAAYDAVRPAPEHRERARAARRGVTLGPQQADGMSRLNGWLDPEARTYLEAVLAKAARPGMCNPADPVAAVDGEPDAAAASADLRTTAQRNHDALQACWRMSLASGAWGTHRGLPVTAIVTMTLQQLESAAGVAVTGGGSTVPVEVALRMATHAHHYLYIYDETCGREIFLGRSKRLASPDQRIVLHAVDGGCSVPGCDQPAYSCDAHHVIEYSQGGTTDIDRLTLVCGRHHKHAGERERQWRARRRYDEQTLGRTVWYPPQSGARVPKPGINRLHRPAEPPPREAA